MARDYAPKGRKSSAKPASRKTARQGKRPASVPAPAPARRQQGSLSVRWILALAAVGGFVGFIFYLNSLPPVEPGDTGSDTATEESRQQDETAKQPEAKRKKPNFRFYEMLPESEVVTPEVEEYTPDSSRKQDFRYLVQTGSFRRQDDAERQRAQIAFQGLRAKIQRIDLDDGGTWFRVNVGPYDSRSQMNSVLDKLVNINIQPLVRKIPKEG